MMFDLKLIGLAAFGLLVTGVHAGPGTFISACARIPAHFEHSMIMEFNPNGPATHCMEKTGNSVRVTVEPGSNTTCVDLGYAEAKMFSTGGDLCLSDGHVLDIYYTAFGAASGKFLFKQSIVTSWAWNVVEDENYVDIVAGAPAATVCHGSIEKGTPEICNWRKLKWGARTQRPLWFHFEKN